MQSPICYLLEGAKMIIISYNPLARFYSEMYNGARKPRQNDLGVKLRLKRLYNRKSRYRKGRIE